MLQRNVPFRTIGIACFQTERVGTSMSTNSYRTGKLSGKAHSYRCELKVASQVCAIMQYLTDENKRCHR